MTQNRHIHAARVFVFAFKVLGTWFFNEITELRKLKKFSECCLPRSMRPKFVLDTRRLGDNEKQRAKTERGKQKEKEIEIDKEKEISGKGREK
jgi:hypothetical protein